MFYSNLPINQAGLERPGAAKQCKNYFTHVGAQIHICLRIGAHHELLNGDAEKTYGMSIDGKVISPLNEAFVHDRVAQGFVVLFGLVLLVFASDRWNKESRLAASDPLCLQQ